MKKHKWPSVRRSSLLQLLAAGAVATIAAAACMETGPDADPRQNGCIGSQCFDGGVIGDGGGADTSLPPVPDGGYPNPLQGVNPVAKLIKGGFQFTEGPVWIGNKLLFSDTRANTIHELLTDGGTVPFRTGSNAANGNAVDALGRLVTCEGATRQMVRTNASLGNPQPIASAHMGLLFNEPNDVIVRNTDGTIYFTDPRYSNDAGGSQDKLAVYRLPPGAAVDGAVRLPFDFVKPNGIALSPDNKILYVVDNGDGRLLSAELNTDGTINGTFKKVADADGGDGMAVDFAGNLYVTTNAGVVVLDKDSNVLGTITIPMGKPANCTFGGADMKTLYITSNQSPGDPNTGIYSIKLNVPGLP